MLVDSHCHLHLLKDITIEDAIARAKAQNVNYLLNVCVSIAEFPQLVTIAETYNDVGISVGLHPNDVDEEIDLPTLVKLAQHSKVIAIGETGLDYYRTEGDHTWQQERFRRHIAAAKEIKKPLIIHTRAAKEDTLRIMREEKANEAGGVMHCFSEDWETAKQALALGFFISFSGVVTFKNAHALQEIAKLVPLDRLLIETDSPYLAPVPYRGKQNEPAFISCTAQYIADLRQMPFAQLAEQTTHNFFTLFKGAEKPNV